MMAVHTIKGVAQTIDFATDWQALIFAALLRCKKLLHY